MVKKNLVIIGISTGGPKILRNMFTALPRLNGSIVIVQHMISIGNRLLQKSLDSLTDMDVKVAEDGDVLAKGWIYIAPSDVHLELVSNRTIRLTDGDVVCFARPSITVTLHSVRADKETNVTGIIMTGMGHDGADGITYLKKIVGGVTIAQDMASSVIWGMPKAAVATGYIDYVMSPLQIRQRLMSELGTI